MGGAPRSAPGRRGHATRRRSPVPHDAPKFRRGTFGVSQRLARHGPLAGESPTALLPRGAQRREEPAGGCLNAPRPSRDEQGDESGDARVPCASPTRSEATSGRGRVANEVRDPGEGGPQRDERRRAHESKRRHVPFVVLPTTPTGLRAALEARLPRELRSRESARTHRASPTRSEATSGRGRVANEVRDPGEGGAILAERRGGTTSIEFALIEVVAPPRSANSGSPQANSAIRRARTSAPSARPRGALP